MKIVDYLTVATVLMSKTSTTVYFIVLLITRMPAVLIFLTPLLLLEP